MTIAMLEVTLETAVNNPQYTPGAGVGFNGQLMRDEGYGYDDYGPGKALTIDYLSEEISERSLAAYFPSARSDDESGHKRGCIILALQSQARSLDLLTSIRRH